MSSTGGTGQPWWAIALLPAGLILAGIGLAISSRNRHNSLATALLLIAVTLITTAIIGIAST